jgi:hypothetical protein
VDQREGSWTYPVIIGLLVAIAAKLHVFSSGEPRLPLLLTGVAAALAVVVAWIVLSYLSRLVPEVCDLAKTAWKSSRVFRLSLWLSLVVVTSFYFVLSYIS